MTLFSKQHGRCPLCGDLLFDPASPPLTPEAWQHWWLSITHRKIRHAPSMPAAPASPPDQERTVTSLIHVTCARRTRNHAERHRNTAPQPA
jgi:RNA-directed DNA polymerase